MLSRRSFAATIERRIPHNVVTARLTDVSTNLGLDFGNLQLTKKHKIVLVNTVINLYNGTSLMSEVPRLVAQQLCHAYNIVVSADGSLDTIRESLQLQFLSKDELKALSHDEFAKADLFTLRDWATAVAVPFSNESTVESLRSDIRSFLFPITPKRKFDSIELAGMNTDDMRLKYRLHVPLDDDSLALISRSTMRDVLLSNDDSEPSNAVGQNESPNPTMHIALNNLFTDAPSSLPRDLASFFVLAPVSSLKLGCIVAQFLLQEHEVADIILFQMSNESPVSFSSLRDASVSGSLPSSLQVWAVTSPGLKRLSAIVGNAPIQPPIATQGPVTDLTVPSALDLLRQRPSVSAASLFGRENTESRDGHSSSSSSLAPEALIPIPSESSNTTSEAFRRLEQYENGRGFRTLLGPAQSERRYLELTGNTGKFLDITYTNVIVLIPVADRNLPGLSRPMLPFLLRLTFGPEFNSTKPWASHLQAFRPEGLPFQYVGQIHTALLKLVEILDTIRSVPGSARSHFFSDLFEPVLTLLRAGGSDSLNGLPVARVLSTVSNLLLEFGALANNLKADTWQTDDEQRAGLAPCLQLDVRDIINHSWMDFLRKQKNPKQGGAPAVKNSTTKSSAGPGSSAGNSAPSSKGAPPVPASNSVPSVSICISALLEKYKIIPVGCRRSGCRFRHDLQQASKDDERITAAKISKADLRVKLETAIG